MKPNNNWFHSDPDYNATIETINHSQQVNCIQNVQRRVV